MTQQVSNTDWTKGRFTLFGLDNTLKMKEINCQTSNNTLKSAACLSPITLKLKINTQSIQSAVIRRIGALITDTICNVFLKNLQNCNLLLTHSGYSVQFALCGPRSQTAVVTAGLRAQPPRLAVHPAESGINKQ